MAKDCRRIATILEYSIGKKFLPAKLRECKQVANGGMVLSFLASY